MRIKTMETTETMEMPVWEDVDVLVIGGSCAAVTAALEAAAAGRRVALVSDGSYLGQDLAGALHLWAGQGDPVLEAGFGGEDSAAPAKLKRHLEQALLAAGVPFLFGCRPLGLLRGAEGAVGGVLLAARAALFTALAGQVIDATEYGLVTKLAGAAITPRPAPAPLRWRIMASRPPAGWPGSCRSLGVYPYRWRDDTKADGCEAFELEIGRDELPADRADIEHFLRSHLVDEQVLLSADHFIDCGGQALAAPADDAYALTDLRDEDLLLESGLWTANRLLPVSDPSSLADPFAMAGLGRRIGSLAAAVVRAKATGRLTVQSGEGGQGGLLFSAAFIRADREAVMCQQPTFPQLGEVDVLVAGGGTGGAPAAIAAARAGAKTLCLESAHGLGGVGAVGLISSYWFGNKCGFTAELNELVSEADSLSRQKKGNKWHPGVKAGIYHRLLRESGATAWLGSQVCGVLKTGDRIEGVLVSTPYGCGVVRAKRFIDATGNADLAAAAGAACRMIGAEHVAVQGTGISPRMTPAVGHQNSDHTFVEENDPEGITMAHVQTREKYYLDHFDTVPFVNSRERRQVIGELEISPLDILAERTFPDTLFTASSNFDTHGFIIHPVFMVTPPDHKPLRAHVPLRCMLPRGLEGVLVTGLGMSAHRDALPVIRMQADVQNQGYAAGLLAARCARTGEGFREVDVKNFQCELVEVGIIEPETAEHVDSFPLSAQAVRAAAAGDFTSAREVAILFAHPEASQPLLTAILSDEPEGDRRRRAALILGLMGVSAAGPILAEWLTKAEWDDGWNYCGMGQFGRSMSEMDAAVIALSRSGYPDAGAVLSALAASLGEEAAFSHCRALALASVVLRDSQLAGELRRLLEQAGMSGHSFVEAEDILRDRDGSPTSTDSRNRSLRELYLARGIFLGGAPGEAAVGRRVLETYARDLRGHFARHARALLAGGEAAAADPLGLA